MRIHFILVFFLVSILCVYSQDKVTVTYVTEIGSFDLSVEENIEDLYIINKADIGSPLKISDIIGLGKLKKLRRLFIDYFNDVSLANLQTNNRIHLFIRNSTVSDPLVLFSNPIYAISIQSCFLKNRVVIPENTNLEYLEISNCGLEYIPDIYNDIQIINFSYNKIANISNISAKSLRCYNQSSKILLIGNPIDKVFLPFLSVGNLYDLIPSKYRSVQ